MKSASSCHLPWYNGSREVKKMKPSLYVDVTIKGNAGEQQEMHADLYDNGTIVITTNARYGVSGREITSWITDILDDISHTMNAKEPILTSGG
jgi:hypothetical protein